MCAVRVCLYVVRSCGCERGCGACECAQMCVGVWLCGSTCVYMCVHVCWYVFFCVGVHACVCGKGDVGEGVDVLV